MVPLYSGNIMKCFHVSHGHEVRSDRVGMYCGQILLADFQAVLMSMVARSLQPEAGRPLTSQVAQLREAQLRKNVPREDHRHDRRPAPASQADGRPWPRRYRYHPGR